MKRMFFSSSDKRWLNALLLTFGFICLAVLFYLLVKKTGKIHNIEFAGLIVTGLLGIICFVMLQINGQN